jgi:hypothetical protein
MSQKNFAASPAAQSLGLGDQLQQQLADQQEELRKKRALEASAAGGGANLANQGLFSPATLALLGNPNANLNG